jgi:hypothetical protein
MGDIISKINATIGLILTISMIAMGATGFGLGAGPYGEQASDAAMQLSSQAANTMLVRGAAD